MGFDLGDWVQSFDSHTYNHRGSSHEVDGGLDAHDASDFYGIQEFNSFNGDRDAVGFCVLAGADVSSLVHQR